MSAGIASETPQPDGDYWRESARPLASLAFVTPLLVLYEGGLLLGAEAARNGADYWLRSLLDVIGFGQYFLLPALTCGLLLAWHHARREPWRLEGRTLGQMWLESAAWGGGLLIVAYLAMLIMGCGSPGDAPIAAASAPQSPNAPAGRMVGYLGAGIYEELLFRLLLVPLTITVLRAAHFNRKSSLTTAVVLTSLIFAVAHYQIDANLFGWHIEWRHGEEFLLLSFGLRFAAGASFAVLFAYRGFGIAVGAHALYDLLALLV